MSPVADTGRAGRLALKAAILLFALINISLSERMSFAVDFTLRTGLQYDWWEDNGESRASQFQVPLEIKGSEGDLTLRLLTGYANTHVELDAGSESLFDVLDTKLNLSYEFSGRWPVDILLGLDFNLPTGRTDFGQEELILIMDPDLISITRFGEGFNVNPTIVLSKQMGNWVAGAGIGYVFRGEYDFSQEIQDFDPGDIVAVSAEIRYFFPSPWNARLFGHYVWYGEDEVGGEDFHQEGSYYMVGAGTEYSRGKLNAGLTARGIFRDRSKFQEMSGGLFREDINSHGDEWAGEISLKYLMKEHTAITGSVEGLHISRNDYDRDSSRFVGSREKFSLGIGAIQIFNENLQGEFNIRGFVMHDDEASYPEPRNSNNYRGISSMIQLTSRF